MPLALNFRDNMFNQEEKLLWSLHPVLGDNSKTFIIIVLSCMPFSTFCVQVCTFSVSLLPLYYKSLLIELSCFPSTEYIYFKCTFLFYSKCPVIQSCRATCILIFTIIQHVNP
jgi:hypothetical protein